MAWRRLQFFGAVAAPPALFLARTAARAEDEPRPGSLPSRKIMLLADLDGTLVGSKPALAAWEKYWRAVESPAGSILCYNTARCIKDYECLVRDEKLPVPDVLITGDGTEVRWRSSPPGSSDAPVFSRDRGWDLKMAEAWLKSGLSRRTVELMSKFDAQQIPDLNHARNSPPHGEHRFAITTDGGPEAAAALVEFLQGELGLGVYVYAVVGWGPAQPHLVCAVPSAGSKGNAALHAQRVLGLRLEDCIGAGDTKGDSSMLATGMPFILVANSTADLVRDAAAAGRPELHYHAAGRYADGVTEGVRHFRRGNPDSTNRANAQSRCEAEALS